MNAARIVALSILCGSCLNAWAQSASSDELDALFGEERQSEQAGPADPPPAQEDAGETEDPPSTSEGAAVITLDDEAPPAALAGRPRRAIEEIVVTATKREQSARDIPVSIDAFSADALEDLGASGSQDVLLFSPGVSVNAYYSPTLTQVQIRGTTTQTEATNQATPVGAFLEDIVLANPSLVGGNPNIDAFDLERVEVLKGPQGTLFGGATLAGALRSIPKQPQFDRFGLSGFASGTAAADSDDRTASWGIAANLPISDQIAARAMSVTRDIPGVVDNLRDGLADVNSATLTQQRAMLRWEPMDDLGFTGMIHRLKADIRELTHIDNPGESQSFANESGFSPSAADYRIGRLGASYALGGFRIDAALARVDKFDLLGVQADRVVVQTDARELAITRFVNAVTETAELRMASLEPSQSAFALLQDWNWLIAAFRLRSDQSVDSYYQSEESTSLPDLGLPDTDVSALGAQIFARALETAVYTDVTRGITEQWELNLGARLFRQESQGRYVQTSNGIERPPDESTSIDSGLLPKLALTWRPLEHIALRGLVVKGYRFAGYNALIVNDGSAPVGYNADSIWNYELGLRSDWLDGRLRVDTTAFFIDWSDIQLAQSTTAAEIYTINGGRAKNLGLETGVTALLPLNLMLSANAAYVDARTAEEFETADGTVPSGTRLPGTPHLTGSAVLNGSYELGRYTVSAGLNWTYQGDTRSELLGGVVIPAYDLLGASLSLSMPEALGQPTLSLAASNLTNTRGYTGAIDIATTIDYQPIQSRMVTLKLAMAW